MATTTINLTDGTFVYQGYPTQAYGQGENFYRVGTATQSTWRARSLINVPLGAIPAGAIINSAKLRLYAGNSSVSSAASSLAITFYARRITSAWTNSATWNNQPSAVTTGQGSVTGSGWNNTLYELNVTAIVQAWIGGTTNHGLMLIQDNASLSTTKVFPKSTAVLVVDYTEPTATITQFSNFSSEAANIGFTVSNPGGGTLTAALKIGSTTIFSGVSVTSASGAKTITLSTAYKDAIYNALGDSVSGTATLTLSTTIGGVTRTHSATATVSIPTSVVPTLTTTVSGATAAGANGVTAKNYAIQNVGLVTGTATATAPRGTTIKSYKWTLAGGSIKTTKDASWVPTTDGTLAVVCTVTDGRGRTATTSKNIAVTAYTPPTLKMTRVERVTVDLNKVDAIYTSTVDAIGDTNRWRLVILTRPVGGDWSTAYDSGVTTNGTSGSKTSRLTPTYSKTQSYELEATLTDGYNTRKGSLMIPTEAVPLAIGRDGIGVGKIPVAGRALDVQGDAYFDTFHGNWKIPDIRNSPNAPSDIPDYNASWAFKLRSNVGNPPVAASANSSYAYILRIAGLNADTSGGGGGVIEVSFGTSNIAVRQATSSTTWTAWALVGGVSSIPWGSVTGKPSTFPPSSHTHSYAAVSHNHSAANITSGQLALARIPVQKGTATINNTDKTITFPTAFGGVPSVTMTYATTDVNAAGDHGCIKIHHITKSNFQVTNSGTATWRAVNWIAVY